ncbi:protein ripply2 [Austrofundulus limnaeus]|uniref:Protein ripply2 n=1 Tax=Austrofundulus limnaeus TaxID=52670 RepID=A0A2I4CI77_AUSLI|nr:PREDICTED: protein ripply2-like [Austrofundulus limnaeus]
MERNQPSSGALSAGHNQQSGFWRPWDKTEGEPPQRTAPSLRADLYAQPKTQQLLHPVKLFWPKSRCFDYLYRDAEALLRSYPIQATICPHEDSSVDEESEDEEEEAEQKQD